MNKECPKGSQPHVYLGDGVHATFDGFAIWLRLEDHLRAGDGSIGLDVSTMNTLVKFADICFQVVEEQNGAR